MLETSVIDTLKSVDPDRVRAAMLAEAQPREALLTLYAFHYELAKIPELVSEPMVGAIRYQWWRDAIDEMYLGKPVRRHEVTTPLAEVIKRYDLPRFWVDKLIDGRERDIDPRPFKDLTEAREYCAQTSGTLARLAAMICEAEKSETAQALGVAWGLTGLLRGWSFYKDSMLKDIDPAALSAEGQSAYVSARDRVGAISPALMPAIAYCALIPGFQKRHEMTADTANSPRNYTALAKKTRLLLTAMRGRLPHM
ncbi:phytoene/squalene synthase family protein [Litorimonas sp. RW-G-Af-16]|uniref:phytoene/squalene synthase family protein n=1 Tax=Litorimonas sp. RW-G-Af-16 TaxID=3241168 RepID=UPI00390C8500